MTDNLLQKLEEKMITLLAELEGLRKELDRSKHENVALKNEQLAWTNKLQGLVSLLDTLDTTHTSHVNHELKLLQGKEEYASA